jgi:hypothetical protein
MKKAKAAGCVAALMVISFVFSCAAAGAFGRPVRGQATDKPAAPAAKPADVASMNSIVAALYDVISGPAGKRDWDRMRSLFVPYGRLIPVGRRANGEMGNRAMSVDDYIAGSAKFLEENGFYEREIARRTEQFGNIAHIFSTYESKHKADDPKPFARGINSIQVMNDGKRWWIVTVLWQGESADNPLPDKYLKNQVGERK